MPDTSPIRILVADDQAHILEALRLLLSDEGYDVTAARSPAEALERLEAVDFDLAILDLNYTRDTTSGQEGLDLMERIRGLDPTLPVLLVTAWSSVAGAVEAMRRGARDYIEKPWDDDRLLATVWTQIDLRRALRRSQRLQEANTRLQRSVTPIFIGDSAAVREVRRTIERVAPADAAVLVTGEHGTGKEVVTAWLHALSERKTRPLVTMNAGGLAEGIAESELFGHVKGAFTDARFDRIGCFELADEGTLFLDEIANMLVRLQAKLLRVLQTGEVQRVGSSRLRYVNVRVLSATNADLPSAIAGGRFREDLLYRLNTVVIHLPPLRDRRDDIDPLADHFLSHYAARYRKPLVGFDDAARTALRTHRWPGNVRELGHGVERAVLMADASETLITARHLGLQGQRGADGGGEAISLEDAERVFIERVLARHGGDVRLAAQQLGMSRSAHYIGGFSSMASVNRPATRVRARGVHRSLERSVLLLALLAGLPAALMLLYLTWGQAYTFEVRWTLTTIVVSVWLGSAAVASQMVQRVLFLQANLLGALREGDYSIRGTSAKPGSAVALVMTEINALGDTLQRQRTEAVESTALLQSVMGAIDVAVFAFGKDERLVLVNPAAERLLGQPAARVLGREAQELRLAKCLDGETPRMLDRPFGPDSGRLELRRSTFYRDGKPHQLLVFADLSRALREEEQQAWQRIVRVLSHEINNSLTPIKSIAHSIKRMISRVPDIPRSAEIQDGLNLIETRSGALGRFLRAYAQLARLPKPQQRPIQVMAIAHRIAELENRLPVSVRATEDVEIVADPDQLEQLLINLVRNAVDAALETSGQVWIDWKPEDGALQITVEDEGPGLPDTSNLFVPFFTTKPAGSGIGLALSRQIAEAHGGTLGLENRPGARGCRAVLRLPM